MIDTLNAKAAIYAALTLFDETGVTLPLAISGTITDASGARAVRADHRGVLELDPPCAAAVHRAQLRARRRSSCGPYVQELAAVADTYVCAYPNAGLPNAFGEYDEAPAETAEILREFGEAGLVNIVGGCCGTTPEHIRLMRDGVSRGARRQAAALPVQVPPGGA